MPQKPTVKQRRNLANTGIFHIEEMDLEFTNGERRSYQRILGSPQGAVLVVPMISDTEVLLIREYAAGMERYELGFPKGHIEKNEDALQAANRESQEETGYAARRLELIASYTVAPGYLHHTTHVVLARDLYPSRLPGDEARSNTVFANPGDRQVTLEPVASGENRLVFVMAYGESAPVGNGCSDGIEVPAAGTVKVTIDVYEL